MCKTDHDKKNIDNKNVGFWEQKQTESKRMFILFSTTTDNIWEQAKRLVKNKHFKNMKLDTFLATQRKNTGSTGKEIWKLQ